MSTQPYTFQYRRPRLQNPTFISNSVASTLSFYNPAKSNYNRERVANSIDNYQANRYNRYNDPNENLKSYQSGQYNLPKVNNANNVRQQRRPTPNSQQNQHIKPRSNSTNLQKYGKNILGQSNQESQKNGYQYFDGQRNNNAERTHNLLNNYIQRRDRNIPQQLIKNSHLLNFNQKDVYKKQNHNYNIITYQPKQYNEHIKKYPKLSLEQKDQYFRMKYLNNDKMKATINGEYTSTNPENNYNQNSNQNNQNYGKYQTNKDEKMAGLQTYKKNSNGNSIVNQNNQEQNIYEKQRRTNPRKNNFNMKMLNHMDEFNLIG